jgi:hypothetical protein
LSRASLRLELDVLCQQAISRKRALPAQYTLLVAQDGTWEWEIYRNGAPLPARLRQNSFYSEYIAKASGEKALREFLSALAQEVDKPDWVAELNARPFVPNVADLPFIPPVGASPIKIASAFLAHELANKPANVRVLMAKAAGFGIHERTLRRAKKSLLIKAIRHDGVWLWSFTAMVGT